MGLPGIKKRTAEDWSEESGARIGRLALMAADGQTHHNPKYSDKVGYPTRRNTEGLIRSALEFGVHPDNIFVEAWDHVVADEGDDQAALDLLAFYHDRVLVPGGAWGGTPQEIDNAVLVLASFEDDSLWVKGVQGGYPQHPQTPGSPGWLEAEAKGNPHESVSCPWTRKP